MESKLINLNPSKKIISEKFKAVEERLTRLQGNNNCTLSRVQFNNLANECGIQGQGQYCEALNYLERVGLCLVLNVCVITKYNWYAHQLSELLTHPDGTVDTKNLGKYEVRGNIIFNYFLSACQKTFSIEDSETDAFNSFLNMKYKSFDGYICLAYD